MLRKPNQVLFAFLLFLSSCAVTLPGGSSSGSGSTGSVPIYQGMTVGALSNSSNLQSPKHQNDINQENPFDLPNNEKLESKIESDLADLMQEETMDYYARPSETVRITINILNPQSYVILSFNLNGRRYQSFEFREGSTSTRLLMDVTLQNLPGVQSLTIDEIKYIVDSEGDNQIRDVVMFGDQTVEVGVGYSQLPIVNVVSQTVLPTTVNYSIEVSDALNILSTQETAIYFYFFDGETLQKEELMVGSNELEFNKLTSKTLYQYAIVSKLNLLSGEGTTLAYYELEAFFTSNFIELVIESTKESLSYEVNIINGLVGGEINRVELEKNNEILHTLNDSIGSFNELLSNNDYAVTVYYDYSHEGETELLTEVYSITASTLSKSTPNFSFTDVVAGKEDVTFEYEVTDLDEVGNLSKIELLKGEELVQTLTEFEDTTFYGLLSNNRYLLKATYIFDMNDGLGQQSIEFLEELTTLSKATPTFSFNDIVPGKDDITFEFSLTDNDEIATISKIELIKDEEVIETLTEYEDTSFGNLLSNNTYQLKATYVFDLNDGFGSQEEVQIVEIDTLAMIEPNVYIEILAIDYTGVSFNFSYEDPDQISTINSIVLIRDNQIIQSLDDLNERKFTQISSNSDFLIKVTYTTNFNDGKGSLIDYYEKEFVTSFFGNGTEIDPYKIISYNDLSYLTSMDSPDVYFELVNDIDLSGKIWYPINFSGKLDGNFHKIKNFKFDNTISETNGITIGFFNNLGPNSIIKNLIFEDLNINLENYDGNHVSSLSSSAQGVIENVSVHGRINISTNSFIYVGGLVTILSGSIINSSTNLNIVINAASTYTGGIAAMANGLIQNSYASGTISFQGNNSISDIFIGGISAFHNNGFVINSLSFVNFNISNINQFGELRARFIFGHSNAQHKALNNYYSENSFIILRASNYNPDYDFGTSASLANLNNVSWYVDVLGWDSSTWNLQNIDILNNILPSLIQSI